MTYICGKCKKVKCVTVDDLKKHSVAMHGKWHGKKA